ncbi:MAG TPA: hypothetical protein VEX39_12305 [Thermoleophilaceae bacterium]|nr:hypothetical protein [Thermoleophilaceae bacterium]
MAYLTITRIHVNGDELVAGYRESAPTMSEVGRDHGLIPGQIRPQHYDVADYEVFSRRC